jgi:magnesium transporter
MARDSWTDLLDPDEAQLREHVPGDLLRDAWQELLRPADEHGVVPRPTIKSHGSYVLGLLLAPVAVPEEDLVYYQEVDFVLTRERLVTIRKTPDSRPAYDPTNLAELCEAQHNGVSPGMIVYYLTDDVAERFLDLLDDIHSEVDEIEEEVDKWPLEEVRRRLSGLRHDLLHVRKVLAPTRDAVREIVDGRVEIEGRLPFSREVFPPELERQFSTTYDKLLRAGEAIEFARDLLAAVRDYQQARVAIDQNEVTKKLTAIASMVLLPTFIVGVYGQNFDHMPELHWRFGYAYSWAIILGTTLLQFVYFRRRRWL